MTSLALEPAHAGGTPDYDPGPNVVETKPKRPARSRRASAPDEDELGPVAAT
jgi:hypothetical protein